MKREKNIFSSFWPGIRQWGEKTDFTERESNFSLDFPAFGPSVLVGARGEVGLRCKGYSWTPVLWSFDKFQKVGVFSYLVIPCLKSHEMVLNVVRPEMAMDFGSKEVESMLDEGCCPWTACGDPLGRSDPVGGSEQKPGDARPKPLTKSVY